MKNLRRPKRPRSHNRLAAVMSHTKRFSTRGRSRLAADAGISRSALDRLMAGRTRPSYGLVARVAKVLEEDLGKSLDPRELVSFDGEYRTTFVCRLCGCKGCLPDQAHSESPRVRAKWRDVPPGMWTGDNQEARAPKWQAIEEINEN